jgi:uncharacterized membrane protein YidH (DUF202 family)
MEKWNKNDYQGKREDQVNYSNKIVIYTSIMSLIFGFFIYILFIFGLI